MRAESADCELPDKPDDSKNTEEMLQQYSRATGINGRSFYWRPIVTTQTLLGIEIAISRLSSNTSREVSNHTNFASFLKLLPCRKQGAVSSYSWGGRVGSLLPFQVLGQYNPETLRQDVLSTRPTATTCCPERTHTSRHGSAGLHSWRYPCPLSWKAGTLPSCTPEGLPSSSLLR